MIDKDLVGEIRRIKAERRLTLYDLSLLLGVQVTTIERWLKSNRINRVYAHVVREKLKTL